MRNTRQIVWGIILILVSSALLFGVLSLSQAEGIIRQSTSTPQPTSTLAIVASASQGVSPTPVIFACPTSVPPICPSVIPPTLPPTPAPTQTVPTIYTSTAVPTITMTTTTATTATSGAPTLTPSPTPYFTAVPTHTRVACGAPRSWVIYIVQKGDTLYHLGQIYGIPYTDIQRANCLVNFNIHIGQRLYVPPGAPIMPSPIPFFDNNTPTETGTFYLPFETPATETPIDTIPSP